MNPAFLIGLGLVAQALFSARFLIQLIRSEKAGKVVSPLIFWQLSLIASFLLLVYGTFRHDLAIVGGQLLGYLVYIRNLQIQKAWHQFPHWARVFFLLLPAVFFIYLMVYQWIDWSHLISNPEIDTLLLTWGSLGQVIFTARFVVQWYASEQRQESYFPRSFWYISIAGALIIAAYAIFRKDAVLFIGQAFGLIVYSRNLWMDLKNLRKTTICSGSNRKLPSRYFAGSAHSGFIFQFGCLVGDRIQRSSLRPNQQRNAGIRGLDSSQPDGNSPLPQATFYLLDYCDFL